MKCVSSPSLKLARRDHPESPTYFCQDLEKMHTHVSPRLQCGRTIELKQDVSTPMQNDPEDKALEARKQGEKNLLNFIGTVGQRMETNREKASDREVERLTQKKRALQNKIPQETVESVKLDPHRYQQPATRIDREYKFYLDLIESIKNDIKKYSNFIAHPAKTVQDSHGRHTNESMLRAMIEDSEKRLTESQLSLKNLEDDDEIKQAQRWWDATAVRRVQHDVQQTTKFVDMYRRQHSVCNVVYLYARSENNEPGFRFCPNHFCQSGTISSSLLAKIRTDVDDHDMFNLWRESLKKVCRTGLTRSLNAKWAKQSFLDADVVIMAFGVDEAAREAGQGLRRSARLEQKRVLEQPLEIEKSAYTCAYAALQFRLCCLHVDVICAQYGAGGTLLDLIDKVANYMGYDDVTLNAIRGKSVPYFFKGFLPRPATSSGVHESTTFPIDPPWINAETLFQKVPRVLKFLKEHAMITEKQFHGTAPVDRLTNVTLAQRRDLCMSKPVSRTPVNQTFYDWARKNSGPTTCIPKVLMQNDYVRGPGQDAETVRMTRRNKFSRRRNGRIEKLKATLKLIYEEKCRIEAVRRKIKSSLEEGENMSVPAFWKDADLGSEESRLTNLEIDLEEELYYLEDYREMGERQGADPRDLYNI